MRKEYAKMSEKNTNDKKNGEMKKKRYNPEQKCEDLIRKLREQCGSHNINSVIIQMEMMPKNSAILSLLQLFNLEELISITIQNTRRKGYKQKYMAMRDLERRYVAVLNDKRGDITNRDVMSTTVIRKNNLEEENR